MLICDEVFLIGGHPLCGVFFSFSILSESARATIVGYCDILRREGGKYRVQIFFFPFSHVDLKISALSEFSAWTYSALWFQYWTGFFSDYLCCSGCCWESVNTRKEHFFVLGTFIGSLRIQIPKLKHINPPTCALHTTQTHSVIFFFSFVTFSLSHAQWDH